VGQSKKQKKSKKKKNKDNTNGDNEEEKKAGDPKISEKKINKIVEYEYTEE
jgi:hypothetical protein